MSLFHTRLVPVVICLASLLSLHQLDAVETVAYRLTDGNTMHFNDSNLARQHLDAVRKLGCEVSQGQHNGHMDVSYRSTYWKSLDLATPRLADQWESWLKDSGFETLRAAPARVRRAGYGNQELGRRDFASQNHYGSQSRGNFQSRDKGQARGGQVDFDQPRSNGSHARISGQELVAYRLPEWKIQHFEDARQHDEFIALMKGFGAEVQTKSHASHTDVRVRSLEWKSVAMPSHQIAQSWENWLARQGFEVRHQHSY